MKAQTVTFALLAAGAQSNECYLPLDVMFLQDTSGSFEDDLPNVVKQIPLIMAGILGRYPGSKFGVAEFRDKPFYPLGEHDDFCYKLGGKLTSEADEFTYAYKDLYASGGGDIPESQFQAIINVVLDQEVGWRSASPSGWRGANRVGARVIIMSTDAIPHLPGDLEKYDIELYPNMPQRMPVNSGIISTGDVNFECSNQDYPSDLQMKTALHMTNTTLITLTPKDDTISGVWKWVNSELLGQAEAFYQFIQPDSSDLFEAILTALDSFKFVAECTKFNEIKGAN